MRTFCLLFHVTLVTLAGCELVVPSERELTRGATSASDAGGEDGGRAGPVQQTTAQGSNTRSLVVRVPSPPAAGSTLIVVAASTNNTPWSVSGGAGVQWTEYSTSATHIGLAVWVGLVSSSGAVIDVTVTFPPSPQAVQAGVVAHVSEWTGFAPAGVKSFNDPTRTALNVGSGDPISTKPLLVTDSTALVFAAAGAHNDATLGAPTNGFIPLQSVAIGDLRLVTAYQPSPAARSYATSWTYAGGASSWDAHMNSFTK